MHSNGQQSVYERIDGEIFHAEDISKGGQGLDGGGEEGGIPQNAVERPTEYLLAFGKAGGLPWLSESSLETSEVEVFDQGRGI